MQDEHKSNSPTWLIIALLSSPVIVSIMDMTKEAILGPKEHKSMVLLETALKELITARRPDQAQEKQKVVYIPVPHQHYTPQPVTFQVVHHARLRPRLPMMMTQNAPPPLIEGHTQLHESVPSLSSPALPEPHQPCDLMRMQQVS